MDERSPVIVGVGQRVQREDDPRNGLDPLGMLEAVARLAADDAGPGARLLAAIDACGIVQTFGWKPRNGPHALGAALGAQLRHAWVTGTGGETPLTLLEHAVRQASSGKIGVALVAGCNLMHSLGRARQAGVRLDWRSGGEGKPEELTPSRWGNSELEQHYGLMLPLTVYPLYENALRARRGTPPREHQEHLGRLMSRFSEVAAKNPYAWFPTFRSPDEVATPTPDNRLTAWPYTKYMNAVMNTDQAACVLVTTAGRARELRIPEDRWVHWQGGAHAADPVWNFSERRDFHSSAALRATVNAALGEAGIGVDDLTHFDLYSCFPSAVGMACEMLGLASDDPRGLTATGGLPYAGGPANAYTLHGVAALVERLRETPDGHGLATGLGWYFTKHAAVVLGRTPGRGAPAAPALDAAEPVTPVAEAGGAARVETYTVVYSRDGAPEKAVVIGRTADGKRFLARTPDSPELLAALVEQEAVGIPGQVQFRTEHNVFEPS